MGVVRQLEELETTGLLWFINRVTLEPRGWSMRLVRTDEGIKGWTILRADGKLMDEAALARAERLLDDLLAKA